MAVTGGEKHLWRDVAGGVLAPLVVQILNRWLLNTKFAPAISTDAGNPLAKFVTGLILTRLTITWHSPEARGCVCRVHERQKLKLI